MVFVQLGSIQSSAWSDNVGVFSGQNIQNSWDSHTPAVSAFGLLMGDFNYGRCNTALVYSQSVYGMITNDNDVKVNSSVFSMR